MDILLTIYCVSVVSAVLCFYWAMSSLTTKTAKLASGIHPFIVQNVSSPLLAVKSKVWFFVCMISLLPVVNT